MVEELVRSELPDYDRLESISVNYILKVRSGTRLFSILLFVMPAILIFLWIFVIESYFQLILSVLAYLVVIFFSIYARFRIDKKYRNLDCSLAYYMFHSDYSMYIIRIASIVLTVLVFLLVETYHSFNQFEFFYLITVFLFLSFLLSVFSPRFWLYGRRSSDLASEDIKNRLAEIEDSSNLPRFTVHVIPERRMKVANAYCTGMIRNRIMITDYLVENLNESEILSILAHELGHVKYRHNLKTLVVTFLFLFLSFALFFSYLFVSDPLLTTMLSQLGIVLFIFGVPAVVPAMRRSFEFQADIFSSRFSDEETIINALLKTNYLNMTPLQLSGGATHPPLPSRISKIRNAIHQRTARLRY